MNNQNALLLFLKELILRFSTKSPLFFKILGGISMGLVLITGVPEFLQAIGVDLPTLWNEKLNSAIAWASRIGFIFSMLTTQSTATAVDVNGNVLKVTNEKKLPFTAAKEHKALVKNQDTIPEMVKTGTVSTSTIKS